MRACGYRAAAGWACVLPAGRHLSHTDGDRVEDDPEVSREVDRRDRSRRPLRERAAGLAAMAARVSPDRHVNPLADPARQQHR